MTAETIIWVAVALIAATIVFLLVAAFVAEMFDALEEHRGMGLFKPKPWWVEPLRRTVEILAYGLLALFGLLFLRYGLR